MNMAISRTRIQLPRIVFVLWGFATVCLVGLMYREEAAKLDSALEEISFQSIQISTAGSIPNPINQPVPVRAMPKVELKKEFTSEDVASGTLNVSQDDERLVKYIRKHHLTPPSTNGSVDATPFDRKVKKYEQQEVARFILNILENKKEGFFAEVGANDGEFYSNTLQIELKQNWTGLLIEADPRPLKRLKARNRKAWVADTCLSTTLYPKKIEMLRNDKGEGLSFIPGLRHIIGKEKDYYGFEAQCFTFYSILKAINVTTIDYFSLDIEGAELAVLKTIPWDSVMIKTLSIEVHPEYVEPVKTFMTSIGYNYVKFIKNGYSHDQIYTHKSLQPLKSP